MNGKRGSIDWDRYRSEFPITERYIYFNNAAVSPLSIRVRDAIADVTESLLNEGTLCEESVFARVAQVRASAASLIGAAPGEVAFTRNTTQGILLAANGIRWQVGDNVVIPAIEFPANVYPWMSLSKRGVELRQVAPRDGTVTAGMLIDACDRRTRAVSVSHVQFTNGYRTDLETLGSFCRARDIFLHVDAIQALGMVQCDVRRYKIDFLSAGAHKWLLATPGIGLFYCRREILDEIDISNPGWTGVVNPEDFLSYDFTYRTDATRFEEGSMNLGGIYALGASIDRFLEIGMEAVEERILSLTDSLETGLRERGYDITSPRAESERSGILCFNHRRRSVEELHRILRDGGVVTSLRAGSVRASPHIYNTQEEIDRCMSVLA